MHLHPERHVLPSGKWQGILGAMTSVHIIYASTSGHTEFVTDVLMQTLRDAGVQVTREQAEQTKPEDLQKGDVLVLASSTWNTGNIEGQLNPHMYTLLMMRAKDVQLNGKKVALIALGDQRYFYTANAMVHLEEFVRSHGGEIVSSLKIVNEPYGQEEKVKEWATSFLAQLS